MKYTLKKPIGAVTELHFAPLTARHADQFNKAVNLTAIAAGNVADIIQGTDQNKLVAYIAARSGQPESVIFSLTIEDLTKLNVLLVEEYVEQAVPTLTGDDSLGKSVN